MASAPDYAVAPSKTWTKNAVKDYLGVDDAVYVEIEEAWHNILLDNGLVDANFRGETAKTRRPVLEETLAQMFHQHFASLDSTRVQLGIHELTTSIRGKASKKEKRQAEVLKSKQRESINLSPVNILPPAPSLSPRSILNKKL